MSLINDALRRANKSTTEPKKGSHDTVILRPIEYAHERSLMSLLLVPLLLVALVAVGGVFFWQYGLKEKPSAQAQTPALKQPSQPAPQQPVAQKPAPQAAQRPAAAVNPAQNQAKPPQPTPPPSAPNRQLAPIVMSPGVNLGNAAAPTTATDTAHPAPDNPVVKEPPKWPELELQAIFYRLNKPSVMINGQNLNIGEYIQGVRVHAIDRESATLDLDGVRKVFKTK
jgi:hypothetical protein